MSLLMYWVSGEANDVVIVELRNPVYNAQAATLQYSAHILKDANHSVESFNTTSFQS